MLFEGDVCTIASLCPDDVVSFCIQEHRFQNRNSFPLPNYLGSSFHISVVFSVLAFASWRRILGSIWW